jgi:hypothetical protein
MRRWLLLLATLVGSPSVADIVSDVIEATELTVYRNNQRGFAPLSLDEWEPSGIAMITETRTVEIPAGQSTIQFRGVADGIVPQTASLEGVPATIVEANFDYDLLAPGSLIAKSLDRPVTLIRTIPASGAVEERRGVLRSGPEGVIVDFGGEFEALNCSGLSERLVFTDLPANLTDTPTLSMTIRATTAGKYQVQLSYLALGMDWSADYTARIHPDGRTMDVSAWITLLNRNGSRFADAKTNVVAGTLARDEEETQPPDVDVPEHMDRCWPIGDFRLRQEVADRLFRRAVVAPPAYAPAAELDEIMVTGMRRHAARASELGDYKLYTLPFATTVEPRQMKQALLLDREDVKLERLYQYRVNPVSLGDDSDPEPARSLLRIKNTKRTGLGLPLPAGNWRVMEITEDGRQYFIGEQGLEDTPVDLPRDIELGAANDVIVSTHLSEEEDKKGVDYGVVEIEISNARSEAVDIEILHSQTEPANVKVVKESRRHETKDGDYVWTLHAAPNKRTVLRYTLVEPDDLDE